MALRVQFNLKSLLVLVSAFAFGLACFAGGMAHERSLRGIEGKEVLRLLQERELYHSDFAPRWNKRVNDIFHGKELLRSDGEPFTFAIDVGDGFMLRYELYEDGTYGCDRVPAAEVAAEMQKIAMPQSPIQNPTDPATDVGE